jgi:hypothetical protein
MSLVVHASLRDNVCTNQTHSSFHAHQFPLLRVLGCMPAGQDGRGTTNPRGPEGFGSEIRQQAINDGLVVISGVADRGLAR